MVDELKTDPDVWLVDYNEQRPHQGLGNTPMQTVLDAFPVATEKLMAA